MFVGNAFTLRYLLPPVINNELTAKRSIFVQKDFLEFIGISVSIDFHFVCYIYYKNMKHALQNISHSRQATILYA